MAVNSDQSKSSQSIVPKNEVTTTGKGAFTPKATKKGADMSGSKMPGQTNQMPKR